MASPAAAEAERPNGPRSRKGAETRVRLLTAAKEIFEENGFLDARISDIAERAGLSHGSFYHYFDSKEEVFREVSDAVYDELSAPVGTIILDRSSDASPAQRLREAIRLHMESYREEARIMGVIEQVSRYDAYVRSSRMERGRQTSELIVESIRSLQRHGLADKTLDPEIASAALSAMTTRFAELWFVEDALNCSFDDGVEQLTRVYVNALGLDDASRRPAGGRRPN